MDIQEQLVFDSEISVAVLGKGRDFVLIRLDGKVDEAAMEEAKSKDYAYCGVLGVKDGQAGAKCEPNPDAAYTMMHAALAFAQQVNERLTSRAMGDSAEWLTRLFELPDTREAKSPRWSLARHGPRRSSKV